MFRAHYSDAQRWQLDSMAPLLLDLRGLEKLLSVMLSVSMHAALMSLQHASIMVLK